MSKTKVGLSKSPLVKGTGMMKDQEVEEVVVMMVMA
jgi:hypothetical protein